MADTLYTPTSVEGSTIALARRFGLSRAAYSRFWNPCGSDAFYVAHFTVSVLVGRGHLKVDHEDEHGWRRVSPTAEGIAAVAKTNNPDTAQEAAHTP